MKKWKQGKIEAISVITWSRIVVLLRGLAAKMTYLRLVRLSGKELVIICLVINPPIEKANIRYGRSPILALWKRCFILAE
jgi:hypothetical protein